MDLEYRYRLRNAANSADDLVVTTTRGGTNPYISQAPTGDAATLDPRKPQASFFGVYTGHIIDPLISSNQRLYTSLLEDASGRQQLGYRIGYWEMRENGGSWQILVAGPHTRVRLVSDIEFAITISDPMQAQTVKQLFSPSSDTQITDFLDTWPTRGCILGGPVIGSIVSAPFKIADLGGWTMRVQASGPALVTGEYGLQPVAVYGPPRWVTNEIRVVEVQDVINDAAAAFQSPAIDNSQSRWDTIEDTEIHPYLWRGLVVLIDGVPWKPLPVYDDDAAVAASAGRALLVTGSARGGYAMKVKSDGARTLTDGAIVRVRALTVLPTPESPIYIVDHPVEILKTFWTAAGIPFSSSDCAALKDLIGTDARYGLKITSARGLKSLVDQVTFPFGIGLRGNGSGEIVPFDGRLGRSSSAPAVTITDADVAKDSVHAFDLNPADAITSIVFRAKKFSAQHSVQATRRDQVIIDGVVETETELTFINDESGALPYGDFEMAFEGMILGRTVWYTTAKDFFDAIARRVFDRFGRGGIGASAILLRTGAGAGVQLGEEILCDLSALPNANYRLGDNGAIAARAMQVVQRTVVPEGLKVELVDSGLTGQPPATLPTVSVAASADLPRTVAEATITNASTLNAAGIGVELAIAFGATSTRYTPVRAYSPGEVPTGAIRLPPVTAGGDVYVKGRSIKPGHRASNYGTADDVTLTGIGSPTSVVATPDGGDGSRCALAWVTASGSSADLVEVFLRLDGQAFADAQLIATLEPGSVQFALSGLEPGTAYIASVRHRDPNTEDIGPETDESFTTSGTGVTLDPPTDPAGFAGAPRLGRLFSQNQLRNGRYGIAVVAAYYPGEVEIAEAVEDNIGAGTYGSFTTIATIPSVSEDWTAWQSIAPNDGLRRRLKARSVGAGTTASADTDAVTVSPWSYQALPAFPGNALLNLAVTPLTPTAPDRFAFRLTPSDPFPAVGVATDLAVDFAAEAGLVIYEYNSTTPAAPVSVASSATLDYEAIRPLNGQGPKSVAFTVAKPNRRTGQSGPIVVPEVGSDSDGSTAPRFDSFSLSSVSSPCDGGGGGDFNFTTANMPGTETYAVTWVVLSGTYAGSNGSASGASTGDPFTAALCPGETIRFVIRAIDGGDEIAVGIFEFTT